MNNAGGHTAAPDPGTMQVLTAETQKVGTGRVFLFLRGCDGASLVCVGFPWLR